MMSQFEFVYSVLVLFLLTQGPVFQLWSRSAGYAETLPEPSVEQARYATYLLAQLPGVLIWIRSVDVKRLVGRAQISLMVFVGWLGVSTLWSTFARKTIIESLALFFTTVFGLYLAERFTPIRLWYAILGAMGLGLGVSWFAIWRVWEGAINFQNDYWIGIYVNRNSLAPVAAIATIASFACLVHSSASRSKMLLRVSLMACCAGISLFFLWRTDSQTSSAALLVAVATTILLAICLKLPINRRSITSRGVTVSTVLLASVVAVHAGIALALRSVATPDETPLFSSRQQIWSANWTGILERPGLGWGWMAAWNTPGFTTLGEWWNIWDTTWSHNSYHDILLGGGIPALVLFIAFISLAGSSFGTLAARDHTYARFFLSVFVLAAATQESFFIGSHFLWTLLVAVLTYQRGIHNGGIIQ